MASQTIKGLTVQIGGDTTKFSAAIKHAEDESKKLSRELTDVNKLLKADPGNINLLAQKQQILTEKVAATKEKLDTLKQAEAQVQAQFEKGDITAEQYRAFQREIAFTTNEMQGYEKQIATTTQKLTEAKAKTDEEVSSLEILRAKISLQEKELSGLREQYKSTVIAEGENSEKAKELKSQYEALNDKLTESKQKMNEAETAASSLGKAETEVATPLESLKNTISEQEKELSELKDQYKSAVLAEGENSEKAKELKAEYDALNSKLGESKQKLNEAETAAASLSQAEEAALSPMDSLKKTISEQEKELSALKDEYKNVVMEQGKDSDAARQLESQFDSLNQELQENQQKLNEIEQEANQLGKAEEKALTPLESLKKSIADQEKELDQLNTEYKNAVVQYGKNSDEAKELATKIKNLSEEHQNEKAKLQEAEKATQSITATEKTLTEQYEDQKSELSTLKQQYINVAAQYGENSKEAKALAKQIDSLSGELAEEEKKIKQAESSADKFDKTLSDTSKDADKASDNVKDLGNSAKDAESSFSTAAVAVGEFMGNLAIELLQRATELIKNFASGTVETGETFEASMSKVKAISGATTSELADLDAVARQYGRDTQFSASECADALTYMALAGWKVDDMIKALPGVLNLAAASEMDLAKASDVVTDYMTAFGWEANRAGEFADKMAFAMANSNTDTEMLGEAYKNCASTADSLHYSMEEVTAAIMTMANAGVKGGESGTALNAVMTRLATDTKGCASALAEYGVNIYDEEGNMQSLSSILTGISDVWSDLTDEQQANLAKIIAGQQQYSSFQTIMKGLSDTAKESGKSFEDYTEALLNCDGAADTMAKTMTDNLQGDLKKMESAYQDLQLSIYDGVNKPLRDVVQTITDNVLPAFSNLIKGADGAEKEVSEAIGKLASVVLKKIKDLLPKILPTLSKIIQQLVFKSISNIKNLGYMLANSIQALTKDIIPAFSRNFPKLIARISSLVKKNLPAIVNSLKRIIKNLTSAFKSVVSDLLPELLKTAVQLLTGGIPLIASTASELFGAIIDALPDLLESLGTALLQVIDDITDFFSKEENLDKLKDTGKKLLEKIAVSMKENTGVLKKQIPGIMKKIRDELKNAVPKMASVADKIITNITDAFDVSDKWQDFKNAFSTIFAGVPENLEEKYRIFKETATESFDRIKKSAENLKNAVKNLFDRLKELLNIHAGDANDAVNAIVEIAGAIASISVDAVSRAIEAISDFLLWISGDSFGAETTRDAIVGVVTAIATFETLNGAITIIQNLPNLLSGLSGAFTGFWGVIAANPLLALISLLVGLIAVLGNVMKTSEEWQIGWQMIKDAFNDAVDSWKVGEKTLEEFGGKVYDFIQDFKNSWEVGEKSLEKFGESIYDLIHEEIPSKFKELIENAKQWGNDFLMNFVEGVSEKINPLHDTFEELGGWIYDRFHFSTPDKGVLADSDTWFPDMMQNFANGIRENSVLVMDQLGNLSNNMAEQSQNAGNRFLNGILSLTEKLPGNLGIHLSNAVNRVIDFGRNLHQKADSAASDMVNAIENRIRSLPDKMTEVGQNLVQGLWNGIQGMKNWVLSQISGFCNNILDSIFATFDIHSPAKTTIYVGKMLDYGIAGGVTENQDEPIQAIRQMAHNLLNETAVIPERLPVQQTQFQASTMQNVANISTLSEKLDNILQAIQNGQVIMLDGDKLVGGTANQMNAALGKIQLLSARR